MCKQLGYPCTDLESEEQKEQIDDQHVQFNKLVSSMKRLNVKNDYRSIGAGDFGAVLTSATRRRAVYWSCFAISTTERAGSNSYNIFLYLEIGVWGKAIKFCRKLTKTYSIS